MIFITLNFFSRCTNDFIELLILLSFPSISNCFKIGKRLIIENIMSVFRFEKILSNDNVQQIEKEQKKILTSWNWIMRNIVKIKDNFLWW